jgi:hypothetical protein
MRVKIHKNNAERQKEYRRKKAEKGRYSNLHISSFDEMALEAIDDKLSFQKKIINYALRYKSFKNWCKRTFHSPSYIDSPADENRVKKHLIKIGKLELRSIVDYSLKLKLDKNPERKGNDYRNYNRRHISRHRERRIRIFIPYIVDNIFYGKARGNPSVLLRYALKYVMLSILLTTDPNVAGVKDKIKKIFSQRLDTVNSTEVLEEKFVTDVFRCVRQNPSS